MLVSVQDDRRKMLRSQGLQRNEVGRRHIQPSAWDIIIGALVVAIRSATSWTGAQEKSLPERSA